nr:DapH/DapD/GlmU-related protein [Paeniglutamicibacter terrestris]
MANVHANPIEIGANTKILRDAEWIGPIKVGTGCYFNKGSYLRAEVTIGNDVLVGPFVRFVTDSHEMGPESKRGGPYLRTPITVGDGVWIGASVTIVGKVSIGAGAVIAAGSLVNKDVPANTLAGGVPAKVIKQLPTSESVA